MSIYDEEPEVVKKSGFVGKFISLLLGIVLGIAATIGSVIAAGTLFTVKDYAGLAKLDDEKLNKLISAEYTDKTLVELVGPVGTKIMEFASNKATIEDLSDVFPVIKTTIEKMAKDFSGAEHINTEIIMDSTLSELPAALKDMLYGIPLSDILTFDTENALMMYIAYGKRDIHYDLDADKDAVGLRQRIAIDSSNATYNEYGEPWSGTLADDLSTFSTTVDEIDTTYTLVPLDGTEKILTVETTNDTVATYYYLNDAEGAELYYEEHSFGDLGGHEEIINNLTTRLTLGEALGSEMTDGNKFFKHVADVKIDHLPEAIENLSINEVFEEEVYDAEGNPNPEWWYLMHNAEACATHEDCDGNCIEEYTLSSMEGLIDNMKTNVHNSTLFDLYDDGMIDQNSLDSETLQSTMKWSIASVEIDTTNFSDRMKAAAATDSEMKVGECTVEEMLLYVSAIIKRSTI